MLTGSGIGVIEAEDPEGGAVLYGTDSDFLAVDETTGRVTIKSTLNREVQYIVRQGHY